MVLVLCLKKKGKSGGMHQVYSLLSANLVVFLELDEISSFMVLGAVFVTREMATIHAVNFFM